MLEFFMGLILYLELIEVLLQLLAEIQRVLKKSRPTCGLLSKSPGKTSKIYQNTFPITHEGVLSFSQLLFVGWPIEVINYFATRFTVQFLGCREYSRSKTSFIDHFGEFVSTRFRSRACFRYVEQCSYSTRAIKFTILPTLIENTLLGTFYFCAV